MIVLTPKYEKYGLEVNPKVLKEVKGMGPQFALGLNVSQAGIEVRGDCVYVKVPRDDPEDDEEHEEDPEDHGAPAQDGTPGPRQGRRDAAVHRISRRSA